MTDAYIRLHVSAIVKARWVRDSQAQGMRLTDWIVQRVEAGQRDDKAREGHTSETQQDQE